MKSESGETTVTSIITITISASAAIIDREGNTTKFWYWENSDGDASGGYFSRGKAIKATLGFHGPDAPFMGARTIEMVEHVPIDLSRYLPEHERDRTAASVVIDAVDSETAHEGAPMAATDLAVSQRVRLRRDYGDFVSAAETGTITWMGSASDPQAPLATVKLDLPHEDLFDRGNQLQVTSEERPGTITPDALTLLPKQPAGIAHPAVSTAAPTSA